MINILKDRLKLFFNRTYSQYSLVAVISAFIILSGNFVFCRKFFDVYEPSFFNIIAFASLVINVFLITYIVILLFCFKYISKPLLILFLIISAYVSYFMESYNIVVNHEMIRNVIDTDMSESIDLLSYKMFLYVFFLAILPSIAVCKVKICYNNWAKDIIVKIKTIIISLCLIAAIVFSFSKFYTSFLREHKQLRLTINPLYWVYSIGVFVKKSAFNDINQEFKQVGLDAKIVRSSRYKRKLVIMVVGEALRADKLSFNGYNRQTMPLLQKEKGVINFSNFYSCGTSTAVSVPCMFSMYDRGAYEYSKAIKTDNILDVLSRTNQVSILWRDNNSSSKGVADRVLYENFKSPKLNPVCDEECRDEGMLVGLEGFINKQNNKDILIILHQMGNHGPAYYKRYPKRFEKYMPVCKTNQLENCSVEEVNNAYDNSILYTDYFLSQVIDLLKKYEKKYQTSMIYMSDHGESLGESGVYLHGLPYFLAPDSQKHIASLMWFGKSQKMFDINKIKSRKTNRFSHDSLFDTLLGMFDVQTKIYNKEKDILYLSRLGKKE